MRSRWLFLIGVLALTACQPRTTGDADSSGPAPAVVTVAGGPGGGVPKGPAPPSPGHAPPLQGNVGGKPFAPDNVAVVGRTLVFRQGPDPDPEFEIKFDLPAGPLTGKTLRFDGDPAQEPTVFVGGRGLDTLPNRPKGYTLTLRITRETAAGVDGLIDLSAGQPARTFLRGGFTAAARPAAGEPKKK